MGSGRKVQVMVSKLKRNRTVRESCLDILVNFFEHDDNVFGTLDKKGLDKAF